ncbi:hypothetical protein [Photobacterium swingsii]|uniref:hypothetical protein n=1 Tax=Photobacterium swingsii TaxID=680026 RepID=UPI000ADA5D78|nr:hypothetical protein [Photobacterium swingsii]
MTTKALTRCYRFPSVDFEPDLRMLVWQDGSETILTVHESRLLEALCYCAGEVINPQALYDKTFIQIEAYEENNHTHFDLNALLVSLNHKLIYQGQPAIAIEIVATHAFVCRSPIKHADWYIHSKSLNSPSLQTIKQTKTSRQSQQQNIL